MFRKEKECGFGSASVHSNFGQMVGLPFKEECEFQSASGILTHSVVEFPLIKEGCGFGSALGHFDSFG